jgi:hypothetical protein
MFLTEGWKTFMQETYDSITQTRIENVEDEKEFWKAKGALDVMHRVFGYENFVDHMQAEDEADNEEDS